jgi:hypothetical protein
LDWSVSFWMGAPVPSWIGGAKEPVGPVREAIVVRRGIGAV